MAGPSKKIIQANRAKRPKARKPTPEPEKEAEAETGRLSSSDNALAHLGSLAGPAKAEAVLELQRRYGNRRVRRMLGQTGQAAEATEEEDGQVSAELAHRIDQAQGQGRPLDTQTRAEMEASFERDFGRVRVHTDRESESLNQEVNATAFTTGQDIFFSEGTYSPGSTEGQKLLAHELTHVVQQENADGSVPSGISSPQDASEREADRVAESVLSGQAQPASQQADAEIARQHAGLAPTGPVSYRPPPGVEGGEIPANAVIDDISTRELYDAIIAAPWPNQTRWDAAWQGWMQIAAYTTKDFLSAQLPNATSGGGIMLSLPTQVGGLVDVNYILQLRATVTRVTFQAADNVTISSSDTGGVSATASGTSGGSTSFGLTGGAGSGGKGATASGEISMGAGSSNSVTSGVGWSGGSTRSTGATQSVRFRFEVQWDVTIRQESDVGIFATIATLGLGNLAAWILEEPAYATASSTGVIRFPIGECIPEG